jgi:hypothetical protein
MNKLFATAALLCCVIAAPVANAKECWISARTGERVCMTTSDGAGSPYKDARSSKSKAVQAMEIAHARKKRAEARAKRWPWR